MNQRSGDRAGRLVSKRPSPSEPLNEAQPLPLAAIESLVRALSDRNPLVARCAALTLEDLGPEAAQPLLNALKGPLADRGVLKAVAHALATLASASEVHRLIQQLLCGEGRAQREAAEAIGGLGWEAREAAPALVWALQKAQTVKVREAVTQALGLLGPRVHDVVPALVHILEGGHGGDGAPSEGVKSETEAKARAEAVKAAASALGQIGTAKAVVSLLRVLRGHPDACVRCVVAECLATISPPVPAVVGPLIKAWADESPAVRDAATVALVKLGETAVVKLAATLRQPLPEVRRRAAAALERMAPLSSGATDVLVLALEDEDGCVVVHAAGAILKSFAAYPTPHAVHRRGNGPLAGGHVPANERALAVLINLVRHKSGGRQDRQHAAETLGRVGGGLSQAYQALTEVVSDDSENRLVQGSARWALQRLGMDASPLEALRRSPEGPSATEPSRGLAARQPGPRPAVRPGQVTLQGGG